jgi:hypothetical protein
MVRIHNTEIDEIIDREMNDEEYEQYQKDVKSYKDQVAKEKAEAEANALAKAALLDRLGITEDEAKLLLA